MAARARSVAGCGPGPGRTSRPAAGRGRRRSAGPAGSAGRPKRSTRSVDSTSPWGPTWWPSQSGTPGPPAPTSHACRPGPSRSLAGVGTSAGRTALRTRPAGAPLRSAGCPAGICGHERRRGGDGCDPPLERVRDRHCPQARRPLTGRADRPRSSSINTSTTAN